MLVKSSVQQDFELVSLVLVQFATRTGRRKGNPKGVDETPLHPLENLRWHPQNHFSECTLKGQILWVSDNKVSFQIDLMGRA